MQGGRWRVPSDAEVAETVSDLIRLWSL